MAEAISSNPNIVTGLGSGMDTKAIIEKLVDAEKKKIEPITKRMETKGLELDSWKQVKASLEKIKATAEPLSAKSLWEGKLVSSSNPDVIEALATSGAKPGKHTLVVDKLALNHQIASQGFAEKDVQIGTGVVTVQIGDEAASKINIDATNNTLQGFVDALKALDGDLDANIIKTGNKEKPYQVVLTSKKTGKEGEIQVLVNLEGAEGVESPTFDPYYIQPGRWKGIAKGEDQKPKAVGTGASTASPELIGNYTGTEPLELNFTVTNTGVIGVSETLRMRWDDNKGRHGYLDLGSFNYTPGEPIEIVDGISLVMTDGEVIVNDNFKATAKPYESDLFWWKPAESRAARIEQPSSWGRQATEGGPVITGKYEGEENDTFKLKVVGSGPVGEGDLRLEVTSENGYSGTVFIGEGYTPGSKVSLAKGLEVELKPGLLSDGDYATFDYQAESTEDYWWLDDADRVEGGQIKGESNWITPEKEEVEETGEGEAGVGPAEAAKPKGPRVSNADKKIVGQFQGYENRVYTFTALGSGSIGVTKGLELKWEDNQGNSGIVKVGGDFYQPGNPVEFDSGLSLMLGEGSIFETDSFTFRTFSPVIQPPQDAEVRLGATELGGGLLVTSPDNELEDVIDGVKLNLLATSEKPVTINIKGDTEKALAGIKDFVTAYNESLLLFQDSTKYDKESGEAGALQGDRNLPRIQDEMARIFINPVTGLPDDANLMMAVGLKIGSDGLIKVDEDKLANSISDDLSKVANLFRSYGQTETSGVSYLSSTENTKISGGDGFAIDITSPATKGFYTTKPLQEPVMIDEQNGSIYITVNGRESEEIKLESGSYSGEEIARDIQKKLIADKALGKMNVPVTFEKGQITIHSNLSGLRSMVNIRPKEISLAATHPLVGGVGKSGTDVAGTINGIELEGSGQILSGVDGTDFEGLKLYVSLTDNQIGDGAEATMTFTKGVGTKVQEYINNVLDPGEGALGIYTQNVEDQFKGYQKQASVLEDRIKVKREKLVEKFARMESKLGQLKSEQNYLSNQLSKLG